MFAFRAIQRPESIPLSLASLHLITRTSQSFTQTALALVDDTSSIATTFSRVVHLYDVAKIPNRVKVSQPPKAEQHSRSLTGQDDPLCGLPYPENDQTLKCGISVEFRNVSFKYPGSDMYALRNTTFKIEQGHLCVRVSESSAIILADSKCR